MLPKEKTLPADTFYDKTGQLENDQVQGPPVILDRSKTRRIRSFIDRAHFYPMLIVAPVTSRTNDVRCGHLTAVMKTCRIQNRFKIFDVRVWTWSLINATKDQ